MENTHNADVQERVERPTRVLMSIRFDGELPNPYSHLFVRGLPRSVRPMSFTWGRALAGSYELLHVHWPEELVRDPHGFKRAIKCVLFLILVAKCKALRIPIVRTVHNETPHESTGRTERLLLKLMDSATDHWIVMNPATRSPEGRRRSHVPHGHYRTAYDIPASCDVVERSIVFFGEIRHYKNVSMLCHAFLDLPNDELYSLTVMGRPGSVDMAEDLRRVVGAEPTVCLRLGYAPSSELILTIASAHLVVLPYVRFHNSGAALLALSVGRPILVPDCESARELMTEFGSDYVKLFGGELTAKILRNALLDTATADLPKPDMQTRDWTMLGDRVARVYEKELAIVGRRLGGSVQDIAKTPWKEPVH